MPETDHPQISHVTLYTIPKVSALLSLDRRTVDRFIASGKLPSLKVGGARRVRLADLEEFVGALKP